MPISQSSIRIKIVQTPSGLPLRPGDAVPSEAWSELRYTLYSYVAPP